MKLNLLCVACRQEGRYNAGEVLVRPIGNSSIYESTCLFGHTFFTTVQNSKFDILYESGVKALQAGYYREAVSSFAVALERFYEFAIHVLLVNKLRDKDTDKNNEEAIRKFEALWRTPLKFSERQIGAFYALYFNEFGESPLIFDQSFSKKLKHTLVSDPSKFRNNVIHEGYIPTYNEALEYGETVFQYILNLYTILSQGSRGAYTSVGQIQSSLAIIRWGKPISKEAVNAGSGTGIRTFLTDNVISYDSFNRVQPRERQSLSEYIINGHQY